MQKSLEEKLYHGLYSNNMIYLIFFYSMCKLSHKCSIV